MISDKSKDPTPMKKQIQDGPWIPVRAQMHDHAMTLNEVPANKYYWDARTFVETYRAVGTYYGLDIISPHADIYNFEIEALGGKMVYSENAMPTIDFREPLIKQPEDLHKLKTPDFYHDGRMPFPLEIIKLDTEQQNNENERQTMLIGGFFCGLFSMAVGMRGYPALIKDMRKRPEFVHELFSFIIDQVLIPYLKVYKEYCGISLAFGADAWASVPNLSVPEMKKWVVPYNQQLKSKASEFGVTVATGSGDYCEENPAKFDAEMVHGALDVQLASGVGNSIFLGMGSWHNLPLEPVLEYMSRCKARGIDISIRTGVNANLLRNGPIDRIVNTIKRYIDTFGRQYKMVISLANIPADTNPEHVHAAVSAVHTYGRLPIADNLDEIEFKLPERETFQEWKRKQKKNTI
ncbi:uroporphyrinogen decarboxylase family protein [Chloroflexota bacterium]